MIKQVDGNHYGGDWQHWDFCEENSVGYLEACASKYLVRWKDKNGITDLRKACSYVEKLLTFEREVQCTAGIEEINRLLEKYSIKDCGEGRAIDLLFNPILGDVVHQRQCLAIIKSLIEKEL